MPFGVLIRAANFAALKHQYLRRGGYDKLPYINHLLKVCHTLIEVGDERNINCLQASLLHDILEDTDATFEELTSMFNLEVAMIVEELTDDMALPYELRKQSQYDQAPSLSESAKKIRIVDKGSNIEDIFTYPLDWSMDKKHAYVLNSIGIIDRMRGNNPVLEHWFDQKVEWALNQL